MTGKLKLNIIIFGILTNDKEDVYVGQTKIIDCIKYL